jgi:hypothetical protein
VEETAKSLSKQGQVLQLVGLIVSGQGHESTTFVLSYYFSTDWIKVWVDPHYYYKI